MIIVQRFDYKGAAQQWQVPALVTSVVMELWGASGSMLGTPLAGNSGTSGASGAYSFGVNLTKTTVQKNLQTKTLVGYVQGTLAVTAGDVYTLYVGGAGGVANMNVGARANIANYGPGGYNGGGRGGYINTSDTSSAYGGSPGAGGGGATDVRYGGTALSNRILVAGGGGGGNAQNYNLRQNDGITELATATAGPTTPNPPYFNGLAPNDSKNDGPYYYPTAGPTYGGSGGGVGYAGGGASSSSDMNTSGTGGKPGSSSAGGAGGAGGSNRSAGGAGTLGVGGNGASVNSTQWASADRARCGGGGGGGGYYGGGGGGAGSAYVRPGTVGSTGAGGGGGSNYVSSSFTGAVNHGAAIPGGPDIYDPAWNGVARFTYLQPPNAPSISAPLDESYIDPTKPLDVTWDFSSLADTTQGGYDIEYRVGSGSWTLLSHSSDGAGTTHTFPAGTFTVGLDYDVQVRVYDAAGDVSGWSLITIHPVAYPDPPVITSPTSDDTISTDTFDVDWTIDAGAVETMYRVQAFDANGTLVVDSGEQQSTRVNLCTNPSFESHDEAWAAIGATIARSTTYRKIGSYSEKVSWGTAAANAAQVLYELATLPGQTYTVSLWYTVGTVGTDPDVQMVALDADEATVLAIGDSSAVATAGTFVQLTLTFTAQGTSAYVGFQNINAVTATKTGYFDMVLIEQGSTLGTYFDGSNANGNPGTPSWTATADDSKSLLTVANELAYSLTWPLPSQPIKLQVQYATVADAGIYSDPGVSNPSVNIDPPGVPGVVLTEDNDAGTITLTITANDSPNPTSYLDIFRTDVTNGTPEERLATKVIPSGVYTFIDYTPATRTTYAYRVRAYSAAGGFADAT